MKIEQRRDLVAASLIKGLSYREVVEELQREFVADPDVGTSLATVVSDVRVLMSRWQKEQVQKIEHRKQLELRRIDQVLKGIWDDVLKGHLASIDRFIKLSERRGKIEGWESVTIKGDEEHPLRVKGEGKVDVDRIGAVIEILAEAGVLPAAALRKTETETSTVH